MIPENLAESPGTKEEMRGSKRCGEWANLNTMAFTPAKKQGTDLRPRLRLTQKLENKKSSEKQKKEKVKEARKLHTVKKEHTNRPKKTHLQ